MNPKATSLNKGVTNSARLFLPEPGLNFGGLSFQSLFHQTPPFQPAEIICLKENSTVKQSIGGRFLAKNCIQVHGSKCVTLDSVLGDRSGLLF